MASPALTHKLQLPPNTVQELLLLQSPSSSNNTTTTPDPDPDPDPNPNLFSRYLCRNGDLPQLPSGIAPLMCSPAIDLHSLSSPLTRDGELAKLQSTLHSWGCFQMINHGISSTLLDEVRQVSREFFHLPMEEKRNYNRTLGAFQGYGSDTAYEDQAFNWNDRLHLQVYPVHQRNPKFWPQTPPRFREILEDYSGNVRRIKKTIMKAMALILNLEEDCFIDQLGENEVMYARFNFYPPCPCPDRILGFKPHSDGSAITILLQEQEVEGLQVQKDGPWYGVPSIRNALFINVGDQMEIMSNGMYKSIVHRVVVSSEKERISVAMLCVPDPDKEVQPLKELVCKERPQLYKKVKQYGNIYYQHHPNGQRPIFSVKI